ncbi:MAG TPA: stage II sporulation protein M [Candidatus Nanoarchaeia archaeon]|nr:stage II sporulation protein M [Candidatus Nanoarchaeia archaeon]
MFEMLVNPKKAERKPWEMFFVGIFYASLSLLIVNWVFAKDTVLSKYLGVLIVTFTVMFSMPFIYYTIRLEEKKVLPGKGMWALLEEHEKALKAFMWLFFGFVVAFSFWYIVLDSTESFQAQIQTYCVINRPTNFDQCVSEYTLKDGTSSTTGALASSGRLFMIFTNNIYVLIFTLLFSLVFGAGVIFILAWNASVIAAAIGIFTKSELSALPLGLARYMIHGIPEIASYFIVALAGGMVSVAVIRHETGTEKFWEVLEDSLHLIIIAVIVLFIAALLEVFVTPAIF